MPKNNKIKATIDDGFQPELVKSARFEGVFEIPVIDKPKNVFVPGGITPFSRRNEAPTDNEAIGFFEMDSVFADVLKNPQAYVEDFKMRPAVISPDCSLYRDAPLTVQIANVYKKNAISHYWQSQGINVLPLVRWGSRDTYLSMTEVAILSPIRNHWKKLKKSFLNYLRKYFIRNTKEASPNVRILEQMVLD